MASALLDTGALIALVNRADRYHPAAADWFGRYRGLLLTTEAMVSEIPEEKKDVLAASRPHQRAALLWAERARAAGLLRIEPVASYAELDRIISKYSRLPCDYADATLIALAEQTGVSVIATIDQRDFSVYRIGGRKRFRIVLGA